MNIEQVKELEEYGDKIWWWILRHQKARKNIDGVLRTLVEIEDVMGKEKLSMFLEAILVWQKGDTIGKHS